MFRILTEVDEDRGRNAKPRALRGNNAKFLAKNKAEFQGLLQNPGDTRLHNEAFTWFCLGPDLVVCDEAHRLKTTDSVIAKVMNKVSSSFQLRHSAANHFR